MKAFAANHATDITQAMNLSTSHSELISLVRVKKIPTRHNKRLTDSPAHSLLTFVIVAARIGYEIEETSKRESSVMQRARAKYAPGHFACSVVWTHWFAIHPRLQPHSRFPSGSANDIGLRTLQLGLEHFAVKNRANMYVFRDQKTGNTVYLR